ncbi:hypothetical protein BDZ45DRAFT_805561 [Acephala macrosclerotiorum]|nr:hypothetical protein BDZ45DRAFT_805561 [Acephala macrosclerotiorum]
MLSSEQSSTQLEIAVLAFSGSSIITYLLYWDRPQHVESIPAIKPKRVPVQNELEEIAMIGPRYFWSSPRTESGIDEELDLVPLSNNSTNLIPLPNPTASKLLATTTPNWYRRLAEASNWDHENVPGAFGAMVGGQLFGGLYCLAWNLHFPTAVEQITWRICSVLIVSGPTLPFVPLYFWTRLRTSWRLPILATLLFMIGLYVVARIFLVVEMFRSLLFSPPGVFVSTWSEGTPHIG